jgi:hypothetical protein
MALSQGSHIDTPQKLLYDQVEPLGIRPFCQAEKKFTW